MTQPIKLQLNAEALEALFPYGSEARVELQNAVVAEFIRRHFREAALGENVQGQIERVRSDVLAAVKQAKETLAAQTLAELGIKPDRGRITLSDAIRSEIKNASRIAVQAEVGQVVSEHVATAAETLRGKATTDAQAAVSRLVNAEIAAAVKARVQEVAKGVLGG